MYKASHIEMTATSPSKFYPQGVLQGHVAPSRFQPRKQFKGLFKGLFTVVLGAHAMSKLGADKGPVTSAARRPTGRLRMLGAFLGRAPVNEKSNNNSK